MLLSARVDMPEIAYKSERKEFRFGVAIQANMTEVVECKVKRYWKHTPLE